MSRLTYALAWTGTDVTLSLFVIYPGPDVPQLTLPLADPPERTGTYDLEDEAGVLGGRKLREFDIVWKEMPDDLERVVTTCLREALITGAEVAWFGFEGSFDFQYLLHPDVAYQIFAVAMSGEAWLALDDERRRSEEWRALMADLRQRIL